MEFADTIHFGLSHQVTFKEMIVNLCAMYGQGYKKIVLPVHREYHGYHVIMYWSIKRMNICN